MTLSACAENAWTRLEPCSKTLRSTDDPQRPPNCTSSFFSFLHVCGHSTHLTLESRAHTPNFSQFTAHPDPLHHIFSNTLPATGEASFLYVNRSIYTPHNQRTLRLSSRGTTVFESATSPMHGLLQVYI